MNHPKCKICGSEHAIGASHKFAPIGVKAAAVGGTAPDKIGGESTGRQVPVPSATLAKRDDEVVAPPPARDAQTAQLSQPAHPGFDRKTYQRDYMRDQVFAKAEGMTVKQWRLKQGQKNDLVR